jgi:glycosyltransferase involved in cell wall biosynthesis
MVKAFADVGHRVILTSLVRSRQASSKNRNDRGLFSFLKKNAPAWFYELMTLFYNVYGYFSLCREIRASRPDFIYERYALNMFCGIWAGRRFGVPVILEVNLPIYYELTDYGKLFFKRFARFSERWICSHASRTIVVSQAMKEYYIREGVKEKKLIVMPNAVDLQRFQPGISGKEIRRKCRFEHNIVLGFCGWFREWHGLSALLEMLHRGGFFRRETKLLLVGDGPEYPALYRYCEENSLLESVVFTGPVEREKIPQYIAAMDITLLPRTNAYGCPMKILEYMAMGKCILAPDQPPVRELIDSGKNGYLFGVDDFAHMRELLETLIRDPRVRKRFGNTAFRNLCEYNYVWTANAEKTVALVRELDSSSAKHGVLCSG